MRRRDVAAVALGGGLGAVWRAVLMMGIADPASGFPVSIFVANVVAALIIGIAVGIDAGGRLSGGMRLFLMTGLCGGLSTFSSFAWDAEQLLQLPGHRLVGLAYLVASMVVGLAAVLVGLRLGGRLARDRDASELAVVPTEVADDD